MNYSESFDINPLESGNFSGYTVTQIDIELQLTGK